MVKLHSLLLITVFFYISYDVARSVPALQPQLLETFEPKSIQAATARGCSYTVAIKTSCSSPSYTRDKISLVFGDSYGNEVYLKRLDDPSSGTFERCSSDTFKINGPCVYDICYQYLLRRGSDGWKPENVKIYGPNIRTVNFEYNTFIPNGVWYGYNLCNRESLSNPMDDN